VSNLDKASISVGNSCGMRQDLLALLDDTTTSDLLLYVDGRTIHAHKVLVRDPR
jgi:hypothetical protein